MYCTKCGSKLAPSVKFCNYCGNPVAQNSVNQSPTQEPDTASNAKQQPSYSQQHNADSTYEQQPSYSQQHNADSTYEQQPSY
ncbi:MAG: zinc ribbon domain-containing protein, partial [Clostridium sp.]|nr:zinc ribbon domain-containing protein [Clostridium sp.]